VVEAAPPQVPHRIEEEPMTPDALKRDDPVLADLVARERRRQDDTLDLIASENYCPRSVREAVGSTLTDKYAEGYPRHRWYGGCEVADSVEQLAIDRGKQLFGCEHINVQPHSTAAARPTWPSTSPSSSPGRRSCRWTWPTAAT